MKKRINILEHINGMTLEEAADYTGTSTTVTQTLRLGIMPGKNAMRKIRQRIKPQDYRELVGLLRVVTD